MSNSHLFLPSGFPRAVLQNGLGRYICQLQRITIKFCKHHGASRGVRNFIENDLVDFARNHPGIVVYLKPRRHRSPVLSAEYLNGDKDYVCCHNFTVEEVRKWMSVLRTQQSGQTIRYRKMWHTDHPSIQGVWSPFTNKPPHINLETFPSENLSSAHPGPTATQLLLDMYNAEIEKQKKESEGGDNRE
ncbi:hypothetical protein J437_LFUL010173 [Ladona fulva]|uniref:Large ribosomal subunit protein mL43 n=1 Tax=Ladona fulva TaxID=123851 RepID=A0A8K0P137_LADFU|nr:hypothetical protein J437_LFUL010173 [Ladona fulva]